MAPLEPGATQMRFRLSARMGSMPSLINVSGTTSGDAAPAAPGGERYNAPRDDQAPEPFPALMVQARHATACPRALRDPETEVSADHER